MRTVRLDELDMRVLMERYGYIPEQASDITTMYKCPLHDEQHGQSFAVFHDPENGRTGYFCFGACSAGGSILDFVMTLNSIPARDAYRELERIYSVKIAGGTNSEKNKHRRLYDANARFAAHCHNELLKPENANVFNYLRKQRGLTPETIREWQVGYMPNGWDTINAVFQQHEHELLEHAGLLTRAKDGALAPVWSERIIIPITLASGDIAGFTGRLNPHTPYSDAFKAQLPKWKNSPATEIFNKRELVLGLRPSVLKQIKQQGGVVLVEGGFDVLALCQSGVPAFAIMGLASGAWLDTVRRYSPDKITLLFDDDTAGHKALHRLAIKTLLPAMHADLSLNVRVAYPPDGQDPDEYILNAPAACTQAINTAPALLDFLLGEIVARVQATDSIPDRLAIVTEKRNQQILRAIPAVLAPPLLARLTAATEIDIAAAMQAMPPA